MKLLKGSITDLERLGGSTTLVLGSNDDSNSLFTLIDKFLGGKPDMLPVYYPSIYPWSFVDGDDDFEDETKEREILVDSEKIRPPKYIFEEVAQEIWADSERIVCIKDINCDRLAEYSAQYAFNFDSIETGIGNLIHLPNWLDEFSASASKWATLYQADVFLNLQWDAPLRDLPKSFWITFDRIIRLHRQREILYIQTMRRKNVR